MARIELGDSTFDMDHVLKIGTTEDGLSITPKDKINYSNQGEYAF